MVHSACPSLIQPRPTRATMTTNSTSTTPATTMPRAVDDAAQASSDKGLSSKGKKLLGLSKKKQQQQHEREAAPAVDAKPLPATTTTPAPCAPSLMPSPPLSTSRGRSADGFAPGLHSPASSLIFERNVQEPEASAAVPAHIKTEDHIPPALDASSLAITDAQLNPDDVEIVMHAAHKTQGGAHDEAVAGAVAAAAAAAAATATATATATGEPSEVGYGALDLTDPRRLSFISFADVVQAEHVEYDRQELLGAGLASPVSSPPTTTTTSGAASPQTADLGRTLSHGSRKSGAQSPPIAAAAAAAAATTVGAELPLQIETMRQALRKTHSGDLSGVRSQPMSPVSLMHEDNR